MRRMAAVAVAGLLVLVGAACEPTEPAMTITAKPDSTKPYCGGGDWVRGTVTPATATSKVILQRTVGGKWVDWMWFETASGEGAHVITAKPDSAGKYAMPYVVPSSEATLHLRVRSNGGKVSPGFYVTPRSDTPSLSCSGAEI